MRNGGRTRPKLVTPNELAHAIDMVRLQAADAARSRRRNAQADDDDVPDNHV